MAFARNRPHPPSASCSLASSPPSIDGHLLRLVSAPFTLCRLHTFASGWLEVCEIHRESHGKAKPKESLKRQFPARIRRCANATTDHSPESLRAVSFPEAVIEAQTNKAREGRFPACVASTRLRLIAKSLPSPPRLKRGPSHRPRELLTDFYLG